MRFSVRLFCAMIAFLIANSAHVHAYTSIQDEVKNENVVVAKRVKEQGKDITFILYYNAKADWEEKYVLTVGNNGSYPFKISRYADSFQFISKKKAFFETSGNAYEIETVNPGTAARIYISPARGLKHEETQALWVQFGHDDFELLLIFLKQEVREAIIESLS